MVREHNIGSAGQCLRRAKRPSNVRVIFGALAVIFAVGHPGLIKADPAEICDAAARLASTKTGVPLSVLQAISLTETGRKSNGRLRPWPWTVNMEGKGVWFDGSDEAKAYAFRNYKRGARSFDVGCFQLNFKWHGHAFASIEEMFDPDANALYAANFLAELYQETGDWSAAAGAYHSRTKVHSDRYRKRFDRLLANIKAAPGDVPEPVKLATASPEPRAPAGILSGRENLYPFLQGGQSQRGLGSLVPLGARSGGGLFRRSDLKADG